MITFRSVRRSRLGCRAVALTVAVCGTLLTATASQAQSSAADCIAVPATLGKPFDVCQKVADLFAFLSPQIGVAVSGGNSMLGEGGTLGGLGKLSLSLRTSIVDGRVPGSDVTINPGGAAASSDFGAERAPIPLPALDAAVGLFRGVPVGLTNVGGVDLLLGLAYVPRVDKSSLNITPENSGFALAYGLRFGLLQESALVPGVSLSFKRRQLPTTSFSYSGYDDKLVVDQAALTSQSTRIVAGKRFLEIVGVAVGFGRDAITTRTGFSATINDTRIPGGQLSMTSPTVRQKVTRSTVFANVSVGYPLLQVTLELGRSGAGDAISTVNTFGDRRANEGYTYGSIGIGFRL